MKYIGNAKHFMTDDFIQMCTERAMIFKDRGRDLSTKIRHTIHGECTEKTFCDHFGLQQTDFSIAEYDAIGSNGGKFEIKHTISKSITWNYVYKNYEYFFSCAPNLDWIVLCHFDPETWDVHLKFIAEATSFQRLSESSNSNTRGSTAGMWFYKDKMAINQGKCKKF